MKANNVTPPFSQLNRAYVPIRKKSIMISDKIYKEIIDKILGHQILILTGKY